MLRVQVAVLSDDQLFREGLVRILRSEPTIAVVDGIDRPGDKLPLLPRMAGPHVVLVDSRTEGALGLCAALRRSGGAAVIFVAVPDEGGWPQMALSAGARGLLGKSARPEQLLQALRVVHGGGVWAPRRIMAECIEKLTRTSAADRSAEPALARQLSLREREVFRHAATGLSNKEVADRLDISRATVKAHLTQIFQKLGVSGRAQLAAVYHGLAAASPHLAAADLPRRPVSSVVRLKA
jgi:DNA-binding NarL/FixJ family response regulator